MQLGVASPRWHDGPRLWWSNLTYSPVSYTAWHDPLISRFKGPNLPSVPELRFREAPTVPHCTLVALPAEMPTNRRWHSNFLTLSLARLQVRFILRKLGSKWGVTLPTITTERGGESIVRLFTMWKRSRGRVSVWESQFGCIWLWTPHRALVCMLTLPANICLYPLAVWRERAEINRLFFLPSFFFRRLFLRGGEGGVLILDRDMQWQCSLLSSKSHTGTKKGSGMGGGSRLVGGKSEGWQTVLHLSCQSLKSD